MSTPSYTTTESPQFLWARLAPGADPAEEVAQLVEHMGADSGSIVQCMGSLDRVTYMIAVPDNRGGWQYSEPIVREGPMEFLATQGTWGRDSQTGAVVVHMHGLVVKQDGQLFGGHLVPGASRVMATCEVALLTGPGITIRRRPDPVVGVPLLLPATDVPGNSGV